MPVAFSFSAPRFTPDDEVLERESMSSEEKREVQQDLYGLYKLPRETNVVMQVLLQEMQERIQRVNASDKEEYLLAAERCPNLLMTESAPTRFLRSCGYDAETAAYRLVKYWKVRVSIFQDRAFLPITLENGALSGDDVRTLEWGHTKILPDDRFGRLVICHDRSKFRLDEMNHPAILRSFWYVMHAAMEDEAYCRRGLVFVIPSMKTVPNHFSRKHIKIMWASIRECLPIRTRAIHACHPALMTDLVLPVILHVMGRPLRRRWCRHSGIREDVLETLEEYGLDPESLPMSIGGLCNADILGWVEQRREVERTRSAGSD